MTDTTETLKQTPLHALHLELGAKMVPFAGYDMPVQYPAGVLKEHLHTRENAGLFDVSHMGQAFLAGADPAKALERVTPADVVGHSDRPGTAGSRFWRPCGSAYRFNAPGAGGGPGRGRRQPTHD